MLSPRVAVLMAVVLNTLGAMAGTAVAATVGKGIVVPSVLTLPAITAAMVAIIVWGIFAAKFGIPVSKSHALLAGLAGAGFAGGGLDALQWSGWEKVGIGLVFSIILGFTGAFVIGKLVIWWAGSLPPHRAKPAFDWMQILSASAMAFNHGLNDGQKFMGVFALTLLAGGVTKQFEIPLWVMIVCAVTMGLGTSFGGWRIIKTVGSKLTRIKSWQGFSAETSASTTIFIASHYGIPLSTTHTITTSIVGASASKRFSDVRFGVLGRIVMAWLFTFPLCALIAYVAARIANSLW